MFDWLKRHRYYALILVLGSLLLWYGFAASFYNDSLIVKMQALYCSLYDSEAKHCKDAPVLVEENTLLDSLSEGDIPTIQQINQLEEELSTLKTSEGGAHTLLLLEAIRDIQGKVNNVEAEYYQQAAINLALILIGIALNFGMAGIIAYFTTRLLGKRLFYRWREAQNKLEKEIKSSLSDASEWPREEINRLLVESPLEERIVWSKDFEKFNGLVIERSSGREGINWLDTSKMLFNVAKICREAGTDHNYHLELRIKKQYYRVRKMIWWEHTS